MNELTPENIYALIGGTIVIGTIYGIYKNIKTNTKKDFKILNELTKKYHNNFIKEEAIEYYNNLKDLENSIIWGEKRKKLENLISKTSTQLGEFIKKEIQNSLGYQVINETTELKELSKTYKNSYGRYNSQQ